MVEGNCLEFRSEDVPRSAHLYSYCEFIGKDSNTKENNTKEINRKGREKGKVEYEENMT